MKIMIIQDKGDCCCAACNQWHEDDGEGRSLFCENSSAVVVRGPYFDQDQDQEEGLLSD